MTDDQLPVVDIDWHVAPVELRPDGRRAWADRLDPPKRVMFLGDTHADTRFTVAAIGMAARQNCKVILQVGDFGIWDHVPAGVQFLDQVDAALRDAGMALIFVDGNHENFDSLDALPVDPTGFRTVRPNILHAPRGLLFAVGGVTFLAMGGAHSIDGPGGKFRPVRGPGNHWWPQEMITMEQAGAAMDRVTRFQAAGGRVDVMLSHDCPEDVAIPGIRGYTMGDMNRMRLGAVYECAQPQLLVCGHYHRRHSARLHRTQIEILAGNEQAAGNYLVADLDPFRLYVEQQQARR